MLVLELEEVLLVLGVVELEDVDELKSAIKLAATLVGGFGTLETGAG